MAKKLIKVFRPYLMLGVIFVGASISALVYFTSTNSQVSSPQIREAPDFDLPDSLGKRHSLTQFQGNAVILHFWASWCPPCLEEIPQWVELANAYKNRPIQLVAVSIDRTWSEALKILPSEKLPSNIMSLLDSEGKLPDLFGTYQFPETYLIDRNRKIRMKWVGPQNWNSNEIRSQIEHACADPGK